ncbi:MAG TPA: DUF2092 domain-containing protein [Acidobacteriota bacterium]|nr:DUF2092 domain-containing protein [Acidobacteriota bacterium]
MRFRQLWAILILLSAAMGDCACSIKRNVNVPVPARILQARTATFQELVDLIDSYTLKIHSLTSTTMRVTLRSGKLESGRLQEYRSAPGYILLERPDSIRLIIQNPITKTAILDLASVGDDFSIWSPTENKFYVGRNSMKELGVEGSTKTPNFSARPIHIFRAILPPALPPEGEAGYGTGMEEAQDAVTKYYIMPVYRIEGGGRLVPVRKYWIDRADLTIARQQTYENEGRLAGILSYSRFSMVDGVQLPLTIRIERPLDNYSLDLEFKNWRVNPQFPGDAFVLTPPPGAERIQLREKQAP